MDEAGRITPTPVTPLEGNEAFIGLDVNPSVVDFWTFAISDLKMNSIRGILAEFLVASALRPGIKKSEQWADYDLLYTHPDGPVDIRIEVKSSAYLQAWEQSGLSEIKFTGLKGTPHIPRGGYDPRGQQYNADVYIFCVQTAKTHKKYNPLDVSQWDFYVLPRTAVSRRGYASITLVALERLEREGVTKSLKVAGIRDAVLAAAKMERDAEGLRVT